MFFADLNHDMILEAREETPDVAPADVSRACMSLHAGIYARLSKSKQLEYLARARVDAIGKWEEIIDLQRHWRDHLDMMRARDSRNGDGVGVENTVNNMRFAEADLRAVAALLADDDTDYNDDAPTAALGSPREPPPLVQDLMIDHFNTHLFVPRASKPCWTATLAWNRDRCRGIALTLRILWKTEALYT